MQIYCKNQSKTIEKWGHKKGWGLCAETVVYFHTFTQGYWPRRGRYHEDLDISGLGFKVIQDRSHCLLWTLPEEVPPEVERLARDWCLWRGVLLSPDNLSWWTVTPQQGVALKTKTNDRGILSWVRGCPTKAIQAGKRSVWFYYGPLPNGYCVFSGRHSVLTCGKSGLETWPFMDLEAGPMSRRQQKRARE